jgi:hypothetical protein
MSSPAAMTAAAWEHVQRIRRYHYYIGRGEQNPLAEDMLLLKLSEAAGDQVHVVAQARPTVPEAAGCYR